MTRELREHLILAVEGSAHWRRRKAKEYPDDGRNATSAGALEALGDGLEALPVESEVWKSYSSAWSNAGDNSGAEMGQAESEYLRQYGFNYPSGSAQEFMVGLLAVLVSSKPQEDDDA